MNRDTIQKILIGLFVTACIFLGSEVIDFSGLIELNRNANPTKPEVAAAASGSRMTYGRFLEYLELGWVKQVDLYDNNRNAIVLASSPELGNRPQAIRVEIPVGASQLIQKLKEYNIDFDAHPLAQKGVIVQLASNLILPIVFIGGLIYFFQNSDSLGDNNGMSPMNLGKTTARFDQKPETGICFDDIAGIDEAKAEFEIGRASCRERVSTRV
jgi:cell division protease FtsH